MRLVWNHDDMIDSGKLPADAPEKPESPFILWAGIIAAGGGSVFFNTYHDTHALQVVVGVPAGFLPPFMAATIIHAVKVTKQDWVKVCVFLVTIAAMVVSAIGAAHVLQDAYYTWGSYLFPFVLDSADLLLLYAIMEHYEKVHEYRKWIKEHLAAESRNQGPGSGSAVPAEPAARSGAVLPVVPEPAPEPVPVPPEPRPAHDTAPPVVPDTVPAVVPEPSVPAAKTPKGDSRGPGREQRPSQSASAKAELQALRQRLVQEFADRPRPVMEDASHRVGRAAGFLAEFRQKTGVEMNNAELGKALRVSKATAGEIRSDVTGPGGEQQAAAGEEEATA